MAVILFAVSEVITRLNVVSFGEVSGVTAECRNNVCIGIRVGKFRFDVKHGTSTARGVMKECRVIFCATHCEVGRFLDQLRDC
jgi:hypothetical protein